MIYSKKASQREISVEELLEIIVGKLNELEKEIEGLKSPKLMYKRPGGEDHEKITDFLDNVENRLQALE